MIWFTSYITLTMLGTRCESILAPKCLIFHSNINSYFNGKYAKNSNLLELTSSRLRKYAGRRCVTNFGSYVKRHYRDIVVTIDSYDRLKS